LYFPQTVTSQCLVYVNYDLNCCGLKYLFLSKSSMRAASLPAIHFPTWCRLRVLVSEKSSLTLPSRIDSLSRSTKSIWFSGICQRNVRHSLQLVRMIRWPTNDLPFALLAVLCDITSWYEHINLLIIPTSLVVFWIQTSYWVMWGRHEVRFDTPGRSKSRCDLWSWGMWTNRSVKMKTKSFCLSSAAFHKLLYHFFCPIRISL
jgi:hypothetical protein